METWFLDSDKIEGSIIYFGLFSHRYFVLVSSTAIYQYRAIIPFRKQTIAYFHAYSIYGAFADTALYDS